MERPDFIPEGYGPTANCPHAAKRFHEKLEHMIVIEQAILDRLPIFLTEEQERRLEALRLMANEAKEYAWYLWKKDRKQ